MDTFDWEGNSMHKHTRLNQKNEKRLHVLTRNRDVSERLFITTLHLMADSGYYRK